MKIVCLSSGGLDSSVMMMMLKKMKYKLFPLHINYGQNAAKMEQLSLKKTCKILKLEPTVIHIPEIGKITTGITSQSKLTITNPLFPARNLMFFSIAAAYALSKSIMTIAIGSTSLSIFPDQHQKFMNKTESLLNIATGAHIKILVPFMKLNKREVVGLAKKHHFPIEHTYSCHMGKSKPCGRCLNCKERDLALQLES